MDLNQKMNKHKLLLDFWGYDSFRPLQEEIIDQILEKKDVLALLPTGGGKSICYQLPALVLDGLCIVVSPLIALMKDQVDLLRKKNIPAEMINSSLAKKDIDRILDNCIYGEIKLLYISPERIQSTLFRERFKKMNINFIAIDEAHCISQWGYDFRPSYLKIATLRELKPQVPFMALTASATKKVILDVQDKLIFNESNVIKQSFKRNNIHYKVINCECKITVLKKIIQKECTIIYVRSRKNAEKISNELNQNGLLSNYYHAGLSNEKRSRIQTDWLNNEFPIIVSTNAFGMGIDKSDVRTVIHFDLPESMESFYQESGRAGRDGNSSYSILLRSVGDEEKLIDRIQSSFPPIKILQNVMQQFCNMHQIPLGFFEQTSFEVDFDVISSKLKLPKKVVFYAFKLLIDEGYLSNTTEGVFTSFISFNANIVEINQFTLKNQQYEQLINMIMRSYHFSLNQKTTISERLMAKRLNTSIENVYSQLEALDHFEILSYEKSSSAFKVRFESPRVNISKIVLSKKTIQNQINRIELAKAMIKYVLNFKICRNQFMLSYFDENKTSPCHNCDNCELVTKRKHNPSKIIERAVIMTLTYEHKDAKTIHDEFENMINKKELIKVIKNLMEKNTIKMENNKLVLN
tara:strand:- start:1837 stop:3741 length:1905 start_codon:yes stop_codon:yes gene_type:complete